MYITPDLNKNVTLSNPRTRKYKWKISGTKWPLRCFVIIAPSPPELTKLFFSPP